eukprot:4815466-Alexandrium_andersonii.AAC.1
MPSLSPGTVRLGCFEPVARYGPPRQAVCAGALGRYATVCFRRVKNIMRLTHSSRTEVYPGSKAK